MLKLERSVHFFYGLYLCLSSSMCLFLLCRIVRVNDYVQVCIIYIKQQY